MSAGVMLIVGVCATVVGRVLVRFCKFWQLKSLQEWRPWASITGSVPVYVGDYRLSVSLTGQLSFVLSGAFSLTLYDLVGPEGLDIGDGRARLIFRKRTPERGHHPGQWHAIEDPFHQETILMMPGVPVYCVYIP